MSVGHTAVTIDVPMIESCDLREVLDRIGDKWSASVIIELGQGVRRFRQLQRAMSGVSQRMLTLTLRRLERDGLVVRTVFPTVPAQVEYELTPAGRSLRSLLATVAGWGLDHRDVIMESRRRWDARTTTEAR